MTKFLVRFIFLTFILLLGGFIQSHAYPDDVDISSEISGLEEPSQCGEDSSADESIDLPSPSHGSGKDLCLPLVERAEEQEPEFKSVKKKLDRGNDASVMSWTLPVHSSFFVNKNLSSLEWSDLSTPTSPRYLIFRNLRS